MTNANKIWSKWSNEIILFIAGILFWHYSPWLIRKLDPTAAEFDSGYLQLLPFAIFGLVFLLTASKVIMAILFPVQDKYLESTREDFNFNTDFKQITPWQRILVALFLFSALLFGAILLVQAI